MAYAKTYTDPPCYMKYEVRDDNSVQVLGFWNPETSNDPAPSEEVTNLVRIETDASGFLGRIWLNDGGKHEVTGVPNRSVSHTVTNPQSILSYSER